MIDSLHKIQFSITFFNWSHLLKCFRKKHFILFQKQYISMKSITWFVLNSLNNIELTQREIILHLSFDSILTVWMRKLNWYAYRLERCLFILVLMATFFSSFRIIFTHHFATWIAMVWIMPLSFVILILLLFPSSSLLLFWPMQKT